MSVEQAEQQLRELLETGQSISGVVDAWMVRDPQIMAIILLEQRVVHSIFAEHLLSIADQFEAFIPPEELYVALGKQMTLNQPDFLDWVLEKHPTAFWLVELSRELEGSRMGYHHMMYKHHTHSRDLPMWCQQYAQQGARDGLVAFAQDTGNPIPAAILYDLKDEKSGLEAAVGAFICNPKSPVLEFLAGKIGSNLDEIVLAIDARLDEEHAPRPKMLQWWLDQQTEGNMKV